MEIKTAGELRGFLAGILTDIQRGDITVDKANAIAKVSAQINQSLAVEVTAALKLQGVVIERIPKEAKSYWARSFALRGR